ncbi:MAG: lytic transglycosylase domain-containing protein, partial [Myxococcota bacterium]
ALRVTPADGRRRMGAIARGGGGRAQRARFQLGLHELRRGRARPAATHFEGFARHAEGDDRLRGRYWAGRAKGGAAGRRLLRQVAEADPFGWYGALACARLRACPDPEDAPETAAALTIELPEDALQYASLGLSADAARRLRRADGALRRQAPRGRVNEVRARAYAQVGDIGRAFRLASRAREELRRTPDTWAWPLAYPRPFLPAAERAAAAQQVPLALLYGIMRQESGYDPRAYSGAGAAGLLQLMENVAARHARRLGIRAERFDAEANIALGAAEMAGLLRRFDGRLPLVAAAYNAGAARVRRWQRELPNDLDLFVELIPFDETRRYVKRVMGHVIRYTVLAGEPRPQLARTVNVGEASSER